MPLLSYGANQNKEMDDFEGRSSVHSRVSDDEDKKTVNMSESEKYLSQIASVYQNEPIPL